MTSRSSDSNFVNEVVPGLYIGDLSSLTQLSLLKDKHQTCDKPFKLTVVTLLSSEILLRVATDFIESHRTNSTESPILIRHVIWKLEDKARANFLSDDLINAIRVMDDAIICSRENPGKKQVCIVHCAKGVSRSAALCAAWLISRKGLSLRESMEIVRQARPSANPNLGFIAGLRAIEKCNGDTQRAITKFLSKNRV